MKQIRSILLIIVLALVVVLALVWLIVPIFQAGGKVNPVEYGKTIFISVAQVGEKVDPFEHQKTIIDFILALLQLTVIFVAIMFVIGYMRLRRYHFVFKGFNNALILPSIEQRPLDLDILAREELERLIKLMDQEGTGEAEHRGLNTDTLISHLPEIETCAGQGDEGLLRHEPVRFFTLTDGSTESDEIVKSKEVKLVTEIRKDFQSPQDTDLMSKIVESTPQEISSIMKLINAIITPHTLKVTGYLQWHRNILEPDHIGITFGFVGPSKLQNLMTRTIWWQPSGNRAASYRVHTPNKVDPANADDGKRVAQEQDRESDEVKIPEVMDCYLDLLTPALHWLLLTFWEYHKVTPIPRYKKKKQARLYFLLGMMFRVCFEQYPEYKSFFWQLAVEHFDQAINKVPDWSMPYLHLAKIYRSKVQDAQDKAEFYKKMQGKLKEKYKHLEEKYQHLFEEMFKELLYLYNEGIQNTGWMEKKLQLLSAFPLILSILQRVLPRSIREVLHGHYKLIVLKTVDELTFGDDNLVNNISGKLMQKLPELDCERFNLSTTDGYYLYNLALLYMQARERGVGIKKARERARRLLAYSLARSPELRVRAQEVPLFESLDLPILEKKLEDKRQKLVKLKGKRFKAVIDEALKQ